VCLGVCVMVGGGWGYRFRAWADQVPNAPSLLRPLPHDGCLLVKLSAEGGPDQRPLTLSEAHSAASREVGRRMAPAQWPRTFVRHS
jgi:hypothetical protein